MTGNDLSPRARLQAMIPAKARETWYRVASAAVMFLLAFGILDANEAALWAQFAVGLVTLVFALIYAYTPARVALYAFVGVVGSVLLYYGITTEETWALITAAVAQAFGIATAAAKTTPVVVARGQTSLN
ncbi:tail length tape measure protein [Mycobacterium phage Apizium]|uniref:Holin n=1 Tax=Mycobacterium phage Apizium TaxID=1673886 RepID=A0A0H4IT37_9CAUD|nr:tail length tape measure protein [Mycobacterium phage Apizium]AKO62190.1 hypothetical protein PBI_APIZIUM_14 [Mycobacterium phage Apizium]